MNFDEVITINNNKLTKKYIQSLSKEERLNIIDLIFDLFRQTEFIYPDDLNKLTKSFKQLKDFVPPINEDKIFNNSSVATDICRYFCKSFYDATEPNKKTIPQIYNDDVLLKRIIHNRLGLDWLDDDEKGKGVNEAFNFSFKMLIQGMRSMRLVSQISIFKPTVAKWIVNKYSNTNDNVYDYSCGFGARFLGTVVSDRNYFGTDPLTVPELIQMKNHLKLNGSFFHDGSENVRLNENSIDLSFSSPPYFNQEKYSDDTSQAYNKGEDYFYNVYWKNTLENIKYMLKPNKIFILNVSNYPKMVDMANDMFTYDHSIYLKTVRSHLTKSKGTEKLEPVYVYKNVK